jgi:methionyl-tRNA synthetase
MYCVNCGHELEEPKRVTDNPATGSRSAQTTCDVCDTRYDLFDESSYDQEGYVEITFH